MSKSGICVNCGKDFTNKIQSPYKNAYEQGFYVSKSLPSNALVGTSNAILSCVHAKDKSVIAYIAHGIGGEVENNLADLRRIIKIINLTMPHVIPFCSYYADVVSLDDSIPEQRDRGIFNNSCILRSGVIDELYLTGSRISFGMQQEVHICKSLGIPVINLINQL